MIRLIGYELRKLFISRSAVLGVAVLLIVNCFLVWLRTESDRDRLPAKEYREMTKTLNVLAPQEALAYLNQRVEECRLSGAGQIDPLYFAYNRLQKEAVQVVGYEEYINRILKAGKQSGSFVFFQNKDGYFTKNAEKTAEAYEHLAGLYVPVALSDAVKGAIGGDSEQLLLLVALLWCCIYVFQIDRNNGIEQVERTTTRGRREQMTAKIIAMWLVSGLLVGLFYAYGFIWNAVTLGLGDLCRPIQSVAGYFSSPYQMSVGACLVICFLTRYVGTMLFSALFALLCVCIRSTGYVFFLSSMMVGGMYACCQLIPDASRMVYFKYLNPYQLLKAETMYSGYHNLRFFNQPVDKFECIWGLGMLLLLVFTGFVIGMGRAGRKPAAGKWRRRSLIRPIPSLFVQESYKVMIYGHGLVILIAGILSLGVIYQNYRVYPDLYEVQYRAYMRMYEGTYDEEKAAGIEKEKAAFEECHKKLAYYTEQYKNGQMEETAYLYETEQIQNKLDSEQAFMRFLSQVEYVKATDGAEIVYDTGYQKLVENGSAIHLISYFVIVITLSAIQLESMFREKISGMHKLLHSTVNGRGKLLWCDVKIHLLCGLAITVAAFFAELYFIHGVYGLYGIDAPAVSLAMYADSSFSSIGGRLAAFFAIRLAVAELAVASVVLLGYRLKCGNRP